MTTTQPASTTSPSVTLPLWRRILFRIGLVLAGLMGLINVANGTFSLFTLPDYPVIACVILIVCGLVTLVSIVPAWRGAQWAVWAIIVSRLVEGWSVLLPIDGMLVGAPTFYVTLVIAATIVAALVALGLRRR